MGLKINFYQSFYIYLLIAGAIYSVEFILVGYFGNAFPNYVVQTNYIIRIIACIAAGILIRRFVFQHGQNFAIKFILIAIFVPIISTFIFLQLSNFFNAYFLILKLFSDILTSFISFTLISILLGKNKTDT
jgi:hypothetical protein